MKFYFDVKETFIKSFAVESANIVEATAKIQQAYVEGKVVVPHNSPDDYEIIEVTEDINDILGSELAEEEIDVIRDLAEDAVNRDIDNRSFEEVRAGE